MHRLVVWLVALVALGAVAAGCADSTGGSRAAPAGDARLVATGDWGREGLLDVPTASGRSLMRATRDATEVKTAYAGDFVSAMLGLSSDLSGRRDWFWYVNGLLGPTSANSYTLHPGDLGWWDHRSWAGQMDVFAVVGSWPEPFVHGWDGRVPTVAADAPLAAALGEDGAHVVPGSSGWRVRVGSDADLRRRDPVWREAMDDPGRAGAPGAIRDGRVALLTEDGGLEPVAGARALAVALRTGNAPGDGALLAVAGLDAASATAAARTIAASPAVLARRYAVAFDGAGKPLAAAGRVGR